MVERAARRVGDAGELLMGVGGLRCRVRQERMGVYLERCTEVALDVLRGDVLLCVVRRAVDRGMTSDVGRGGAERDSSSNRVLYTQQHLR